MTDDPGLRLDRRELLSGAVATGTATLAGCGGVLPDDSPPTIDRADLRAATDGDAPTVPDTFPVNIEGSFVEGQRDLARSKLDAIPAPFDEAAIPNGVIRERLNDAYDDALRSIRDAADAPTPYERLGHASSARADAQEVRAGWGAIDGELTVGDLREAVADVNGDVDAFASAHSYVGDDPVRAAVVHAELEGMIRGARRWLSVPDREFAAAEVSLELADLAVEIERARADVAVGSYLFDRFRGGLDAATDRRERLVDARETLEARIVDRADSVPEEQVEDPTTLVERDIGTTAGIRALEGLGREARSRIEQVRRAEDGSDPASNVVGATLVLTHIRAFERLRDRIEDGDDIAVETADDVADVRSAAVSAVEAAGDAARGQVLVDTFRPRIAGDFEWIDADFEDGPDDVRVDLVSRDAAGYVRIAELARALPTVAGTVAATLRESA